MLELPSLSTSSPSHSQPHPSLLLLTFSLLHWRSAPAWKGLFFPFSCHQGGDVEEKAADQQEQTLAQEKLSSVSQPQGVRKGGSAWSRLMRTQGERSVVMRCEFEGIIVHLC